MDEEKDGRDGEANAVNVAPLRPRRADRSDRARGTAQRSRCIRRGEDGRSRERLTERADLRFAIPCVLAK